MKCYWGGPTEGGLQTAINLLPADQLASTIVAVQAIGATCEEWNTGTLCTYATVIEPSEEDPTRWNVGEQYYFRDGWWITTWQAYPSDRMINEGTMPLYETLWP